MLLLSIFISLKKRYIASFKRGNFFQNENSCPLFLNPFIPNYVKRGKHTKAQYLRSMFKLSAVVPQVEILEKERAEERKRYEAKRNLMLSDFAHDLRTPIMTIGGYANAITDGMVKDEAQKTEYLTAIAAKSKRMTELITMLFEYVRVGSEGFIIKKAPGVEILAVADSEVQMEKTEDELFEPFVKGKDSRSQHTGSGLGLSVVKQVMDMHGFDIHLKQPYGEYTKAFVLKFYECSIIDI